MIKFFLLLFFFLLIVPLLRGSIDKFRDKSVAKSWKEADELPYWGKVII